MAFTPVKSRIPGTIGKISIVIEDPANQAIQDTIAAQIEVFDTDGKLMEMQDDNLLPHLLTAEIQWLQNFVPLVRQRAQTLIP